MNGRDRNPVRRNEMNNTIESEKSASAPEVAQAKAKRRPANNAAAAKKPRAKKPTSKPKAGRAKKKAEVIAIIKRGNGATLAEIVKTTGWQQHTVRAFVSILGSKCGETIESSKNTAGGRTYKIGK
jgi:hypothetical protein